MPAPSPSPCAESAPPFLVSDKDLSITGPAAEDAAAPAPSYRDQYRTAAASDPHWGVSNARCGGRCLVREVDGRIEVRPALCGQWACSVCGPQRAAWLKRQLATAQDRDGLAYVWTLTLRGGAGGAAESYARATRAFNTVRTNLRRDYGPFEYIWVAEPTEQGWCHLHVLTDLPIDQADLSRRWRAATGGSWVVDVSERRGAGTATYLTKACTALASQRLERGWGELRSRHIFGRSRGIAFEPFRPKGSGDWRLWDRPYWQARRALHAAGADVLDDSTERVPRLAVAGRLVGGCVPSPLAIPSDRPSPAPGASADGGCLPSPDGTAEDASERPYRILPASNATSRRTAPPPVGGAGSSESLATGEPDPTSGEEPTDSPAGRAGDPPCGRPSPARSLAEQPP